MATSDFDLGYEPSLASELPVTASDRDRSRAEREYTIFRHRRMWSDLYTVRCLTWDLIPWPVFNMKSLLSLNEIMTDEVESYLCSQYQSPDNTFGTMEDYVKDVINQWDYNRMEARVFERVHVEHRENVKLGVVRVGRILRDILLKERQTNQAT
jgi:hypothetical protein